MTLQKQSKIQQSRHTSYIIQADPFFRSSWNSTKTTKKQLYIIVWQVNQQLNQSSHYYHLAGSYCHQSWPRWFPDLQQLGLGSASANASECLSTCMYSLTTLNAWENTLGHNCGLHIAHVHKNPRGSRDFPNQALLFLNCTPISFFAASFCLFSLFSFTLFSFYMITARKSKAWERGQLQCSCIHSNLQRYGNHYNPFLGNLLQKLQQR